jgi:phosphoribosyl-ATP pyrophosphohydrolase
MTESNNHPIIEKEALDALQTEIGSWSAVTFPNSDRGTILRHLREEVEELFAAQDDELPHEIADCIMLLLHLAHKNGISARDAIREKFEICKLRKWGPPDEHGVVRHVKEPNEDHR